MKDSDIPALAADWASYPNVWWKQRAADAVQKGWYRCIHGRNDNDVYLVRMWLSVPKIIEVNSDEEMLDSGESVMLHYFCRGDDDKALHDHPWDFTTSIIEGWYDEHLPPGNWSPLNTLGPAYDQNIVRHLRGSTIRHNANDLHFVGTIAPETVTLVTTSAKKRCWGFWAPDDKWLPWRQYLENLKT